MSLHLIPGRKHAKHRGKSGLQLQRELAAAERKIVSLTAGTDQISAAGDDLAAQLGTAREEISQLEAAVRQRDQRIAELERRVDVGVKAEHVIAKTQEFDASEIQQRYATPTPLWQAPFASTDPAHVPASALRT